MSEVLKIIIADDNTSMVNVMKGWIEENEKYKVIGIANDRESETNLIETLKPDLVITDLKRKGDWGGLDIIKDYNNKENSPLFFIVSAGVYGYIDELRKLGIRYFLPKPFRTEDLMDRLSYIYNDVYPSAIVEIKKEVPNIKDRNFFDKLRKILKKRMR